MHIHFNDRVSLLHICTLNSRSIGLIEPGCVLQCNGSRPSTSLTSGLAPFMINNSISETAP